MLRTGGAAALLQQSFDHYDDPVPLQSVWEVEPGEAATAALAQLPLPKPGGTPRSRRTSARDALAPSRESESNHVEALWKRQTAAERSSWGREIAHRAV
jgi:hypothetical protein